DSLMFAGSLLAEQNWAAQDCANCSGNGNLNGRCNDEPGGTHCDVHATFDQIKWQFPGGHFFSKKFAIASSIRSISSGLRAEPLGREMPVLKRRSLVPSVKARRRELPGWRCIGFHRGRASMLI